MIAKFLKDKSFIVGTKSFPEKTPFIRKYLEKGNLSGVTPQSFQATCFLQKMDWQKTRECQDQWWVLDRWGPSGTIYGYLDDTYETNFKDFMNYSDPNYRLLEKPAVGYLLVGKPDKILARLCQRGESASCYESKEKQARLYDMFRMYAEKDPSYKLIDTTNLTLTEVFDIISVDLVKTFSL